MKSKYWFFEKWGITPENSIMDYIEKLEARIEKLEEENVETTNTLYELQNSIEAVDRRVDIIGKYDVKLYQEVKRYYGAE